MAKIEKVLVLLSAAFILMLGYMSAIYLAVNGLMEVNLSNLNLLIVVLESAIFTGAAVIAANE